MRSLLAFAAIVFTGLGYTAGLATQQIKDRAAINAAPHPEAAQAATTTVICTDLQGNVFVNPKPDECRNFKTMRYINLD